MNTNELMEKLAEALNDENIAKRIEDAQSLEEIQKCLADGGLELTMEETEALLAGIHNGSTATEEDEEMSDNELEMINGGTFSLAAIIAGGAMVAGGLAIARMATGFGHAAGGSGEYKAGAISPIYGMGFHLGKIFKSKFN